jgi:hypothetical protein
MRAVRLVILTLAAAVIVSATQFPYAATLQTRADYGAAIDRVTAEYNNAREECDPIAGHDKAMCMVEAKAAEKRARAVANANYLGTVNARRDSRIASADAGWMIARTSCDAKVLAEKSACVQRAKTENIRLVAAADAGPAR